MTFSSTPEWGAVDVLFWTSGAVVIGGACVTTTRLRRKGRGTPLLWCIAQAALSMVEGGRTGLFHSWQDGLPLVQKIRERDG